MEKQFCKVGNTQSIIFKANNNHQTRTNKMNIIKTVQLKTLQIITAVATLLFAFTANAQVEGWNPELEHESRKALNTILEKRPRLESFKNKAYGYAVFPRITKAAIGIGGAAGNGIVYENHKSVGSAHLKQATVGIQFGGQQYAEVIFFKNEETFKKFTNGKLKFDAQASAVLLKAGAAIDAAYQDGVAIFTATKGGFMYEASVGGQHFKYEGKVWHN
jgi:lipid-binding SYLF domain-containing protein